MNIQRPRSKTSGQGLRSSLAIPFVITVAALAPGCAQETPADEETEEAQLAVTEAQLDEPAPEPETSVSSTSASRVIFNPPPLRPPLNPPRPPLNPPLPPWHRPPFNPPLPPWHRPPFNPPRPPWHHGPPPGNPPAAPWSEDDR